MIRSMGGVAARRLGLAGITLVCAMGSASALATTSKLYVLKHPRREHCRAHYIRSWRTVAVNGRNVRQVVCAPPLPLPLPPSPLVRPAAEPRYISTAHAAKQLASIIRRVATQQYQSVTGDVTVEFRSDGVKVLRVHIPRISFVVRGGYVFTLETLSNLLVGVGLEESVEEVVDEVVDAGRGPYEKWSFVIAGSAGFSQREWLATVDYDDHTSKMSGGNVFSVESSGGACAVGRKSLPVPLYKEVLSALVSASKEEISGFVRLPLAVCE